MLTAAELAPLEQRSRGVGAKFLNVAQRKNVISSGVRVRCEIFRTAEHEFSAELLGHLRTTAAKIKPSVRIILATSVIYVFHTYIFARGKSADDLHKK